MNFVRLTEVVTKKLYDSKLGRCSQTVNNRGQDKQISLKFKDLDGNGMDCFRQKAQGILP